jgi:hypothetical protein
MATMFVCLAKRLIIEWSVVTDRASLLWRHCLVARRIPQSWIRF